MIRKLLNPVSAWETSSFSDIPMLSDSASEAVRHFCIIAGGLALILSRNRATSIERNYSYTAELYELLSKELRKHGKTSAGAGLIINVMHEVADVADPLTMASLRRCLEYRRQHDVKRGRSSADPDGKQAAGAASQPDGFRASSDVSRSPSADPQDVVQGIDVSQGDGNSQDPGDEAARRLKTAVELARKRRQALMPVTGAPAAQSRSDGKIASSL